MNKQEFWPGGVYAQTSEVDLKPLRPRLVALGREIIGDEGGDEQAYRAATSTRCWCGLGCTFRCVYRDPRHVGDSLSVFNWSGNSMANATLAAAVGNNVTDRDFDVHLDVGAGGGRTIVEIEKVATRARLIAVEPHAAHRELLGVVRPDAEIIDDISGVEPMRGSRCLVTLAGLLNCVPGSVVDELVKTISTVGAGSVIATLDFTMAPGRAAEFERKLADAFGHVIEPLSFHEDDRNVVRVWAVAT